MTDYVYMVSTGTHIFQSEENVILARQQAEKEHGPGGDLYKKVPPPPVREEEK